MTEYADRPQQHASKADVDPPAGRPVAARARTLQRVAAGLNERPRVERQARLADALSTGRPGGLPPALQAGVEALSGIAMNDVRVHRNSSRPAQLQAHAFTQGRDIHVAPGQDHHLPHEAWHVVQQKQGRVKPTLQAKGIPINDDPGLETEADRMGARAMRTPAQAAAPLAVALGSPAPAQRVVKFRQMDGSLSPEGATREQIVTWLSNGGMRRLPGMERAIDRLIRSEEMIEVKWLFGQAAFMRDEVVPNIRQEDVEHEQVMNAAARPVLAARAAARAAAAPVAAAAPMTTAEARSRLADLMTQFTFIMEQKGAYADLWRIYREGRNRIIGETMARLEQYYNEAVDIERAVSARLHTESAAAGPAELPDELIARIQHLSRLMEAAPRALSRAEALLRAAEEKEGHGGGGHSPEAILRMMRNAENAAEWDATAKKMSPVLKKGWVLGPAAIIAKIDHLVARYVGAWDAMGTDGLKGASIEAIRRLEMIRVDIATLIANSGNIALQICCGPGSQFFEYIMSLARQTCSSREVQNFKGWWDAHKRED